MERSTKVQSPAAVAALSIVTLGVYACVWYYRVNREMRDYGRASGDEALAASKPVRSLLAWVPGGWIVVPLVVSFARATQRVARCERLARMEPNGTGSLIVLMIVACATGLASAFAPGTTAAVLVVIEIVCWLTVMAAVQRRLNAIWQRVVVIDHAAPERASAAA
ncbi:MAG: hypothetical protein QOH72_3671 [Solirubrobacteraceae bacterium]|nr:hypothetical protein [Solirubrobacteraceae bacterium]